MKFNNSTKVLGATILLTSVLAVGYDVKADAFLNGDFKKVASVADKTITAAAVSLSDINGHWAEASIRLADQKGLVAGYDDGTFRPEEKVSRAELAAFLVRASDGETKAANISDIPFSDVRNHWGKEYIAQAISLGFIDPSEYGSQFDPNKAMSRSEIAMWMAKGLASKDESYKQALIDTKGTLLPISETYQGGLNEKDVPYIAVMIGTGLMTGNEDGTFGTKKNLTRAETAAILTRYMDLFEKKATDFPHMRELIEVGKTGTNLTTVTKFQYQFKDKTFSDIRDKEITLANEKAVTKIHRIIAVSDKNSLYFNMFFDDDEKFFNENQEKYYFLSQEMSITPLVDSINNQSYRNNTTPLTTGATINSKRAVEQYGVQTIPIRDTHLFYEKGNTKRVWARTALDKTPDKNGSFTAVGTDDGSDMRISIKE